MGVEQKGDGSPLTLADRRAHTVIVRELEKYTPEIPVLSEESNESVMAERKNWNRFWLVDPLDGTKEFVKRNGEFTVNIALIDERMPILGVVYVPVRKTLYAGELGSGAWLTDAENHRRPIAVADFKAEDTPTVVASRSHAGGSTQQYLANLEKDLGEPVVRSMGSSLKICLVAEGAAHVYPRLGPTSEWDTAAAHALVRAAGGSIVDETGQELSYNKDNILNPWFFVLGGGDQDWLQYLQGVSRDSFGSSAGRDSNSSSELEDGSGKRALSVLCGPSVSLRPPRRNVTGEPSFSPSVLTQPILDRCMASMPAAIQRRIN